jgi:RNA 2',3'-cyclic 3'-phosphodiesterase
MRQFIAIPLPEATRQAVDNILEPFREIEGIRPVKPENMHITLLFLGDKGSEGKIDKVRKIQFREFDLSSTSVRLFPEKRPGLIWIELEKNVELNHIHRQLADIYGVEEEFRAHITIARIKWLSPDNRKKLRGMTRQLNQFSISFRVNQFNLYESELKPAGPVYRIIESFKA